MFGHPEGLRRRDFPINHLRDLIGWHNVSHIPHWAGWSISADDETRIKTHLSETHRTASKQETVQTCSNSKRISISDAKNTCDAINVGTSVLEQGLWPLSINRGIIYSNTSPGSTPRNLKYLPEHKPRIRVYSRS